MSVASRIHRLQATTTHPNTTLPIAFTCTKDTEGTGVNMCAEVGQVLQGPSITQSLVQDSTEPSEAQRLLNKVKHGVGPHVDSSMRLKKLSSIFLQDNPACVCVCVCQDALFSSSVQQLGKH